MNVRLELKTVAVRHDGCFSVLLWDGKPFAVSVERTFDEGAPVIDNGKYLCKRDYYNKGGYATYEIQIAGHDRVLFHKGNVETNSEACICVAESFGVLDGATAVLDSQHGFDEFIALTDSMDSFGMEVSGR